MQSRDEYDRLVDTSIFEKATNLEETRQKLEAAQAKGAVSHTLAPLPKSGDVVEIHGLTYKVKYSAPGRGRLILELEKPAEEAQQA